MSSVAEDIRKITKWVENKDQDGYHEGWYEFESVKPVNIPGMGTVNYVESGRDGDDFDSYVMVLKVTPESDSSPYLLRVSGYYSSWDGVDWGDATIEEVEVYEEVVKRYRSVG